MKGHATPASGGDELDEIPDLTDQVEIVRHEPRAAARADDGSTHRRLFESTLHSLTADVREAMAGKVVDPELSALCFDPVSRVVRRLLDNPRFGIGHARLIAAHHLNASGLDALGARGAIFGDNEVQRRLLRNPQTPIHLVRRILSRRRMVVIFNASQSHEITDRNRNTARETLRQRFATSQPEEKVDLILTTEGRALAVLAALPLDAKATALLCKQTIASHILVRNLAIWGPTPQVLLAHLLRQTIVRTNPQLRTIVKRHPNCSHAGD